MNNMPPIWVDGLELDYFGTECEIDRLPDEEEGDSDGEESMGEDE